MCVLRPGIPGVSETIRVRSIVGRFLEHSRIFCFENAGDREVYIGSADWMGRNLDRRVESVVPVLDPGLRDVLCDDVLDVFVRDNVKSRTLHADGTYERRVPLPGEPRVDAQQIFLGRYRTFENRENRVPVALFDRLDAERPRRSSVMPSSWGTRVVRRG